MRLFQKIVHLGKTSAIRTPLRAALRPSGQGAPTTVGASEAEAPARSHAGILSGSGAVCGRGRISRREGQIIVESIIALSILLVSFLGIFTLLSSSLRNNRVIADNLTATYLAAEGIEVVKNMIDHNSITGASWGSGFSSGDFEVDYQTTAAPLSSYGSGRNLFFNPVSNVYDYSGGGTATTYKRRVRIALNGDEMRVNSIVSWTTGSAQSSVNLEDHFFNWRP